MSKGLEEGSAVVHDASCDVWKVAEASSPDALISAGYQSEEIAIYLASVSPVYAALSRVLAQFSGILLLAMTDTRTVIGLDRAMWRTARDQLAEAQERLADVAVPVDARKHRNALVRTGVGLADAATRLEQIAAYRDPIRRKSQVNHTLQSLKIVQRLLIATAEPDANITPVDFEGGCCSCRKLLNNT